MPIPSREKGKQMVAMVDFAVRGGTLMMSRVIMRSFTAVKYSHSRS